MEIRNKYDDFPYDSSLNCSIGDAFNAGRECSLVFNVTHDMQPPILVHYQLTNFHQNHRSYYQARDDYQLLGQGRDQLGEKRCKPLYKLGDLELNPCGVAANTFFNDVFKLVQGKDASGEDLVMREDGIAWQSDIDYAFAQPAGFRYKDCSEDGLACDKTCCEYVDTDGDYAGEAWSCDEPHIDEETDICYRYHYPNDDTTQYLYETYKGIISPIKGVTDEHFIVWMRTATQPTFRKLYGWIDKPIRKGEVLVMNVTANYVVSRFRGSKELILSTNNVFGGRNPFMGRAFFWMGIYCLVAGTFFALKQGFRPRRLADPNYLHYKVD